LFGEAVNVGEARKAVKRAAPRADLLKDQAGKLRMGFFKSVVRQQISSSILVLACLMMPLVLACRDRSQTSIPAASAPSVIVDPWNEAVAKVEQDRGEPMGRQARVEVPAQLKHYEDRRRFLSVQVAESRESQIETPYDFADLVRVIRKGGLVQVPALGDGFILYGVGKSATDEPLTHYDRESKKSVPLFGSDNELKQEYARIATSLEELKKTLNERQQDLKQIRKRDREQRSKLQTEINQVQKESTTLNNEKKLLETFYSNPDSRKQLTSEYETLNAFAREKTNPPYDLSDPTSRKALRIQLLSYLRPAALNILKEVARAYQAQFARPLPVSSLVRTDEYQRQLHMTNPNATLIDVPPHSTGLAFDIYYRYMTAAEQTFVMYELSHLYDQGKIEVLRENANHFHVFAFAHGHPPRPELVENTLDEVGPDPNVKPTSQRRSPRAAQRTSTRRASRRHSARR
jgi:hypothetical protein